MATTMNGTNSQDNELVRNGERISIAYHSLRKGEAGLDNLPLLLEQIGEDEMYKRFIHPETGEVLENKNFTEFVCSTPPKGLGSSKDTVRRLCKSNERILWKVDTWMTGKPHRPPKEESVYNVNTYGRTTGNTASYALRKLSKDAPEIHERVINGELSPHAGMVEAGFRKRQITFTHSVDSAINMLRNKFTKDELARIRAAL